MMNQMSSTISYEDFGLDLIMNAQKKAKKTDNESAKTQALNKLHKSFQILLNRVSGNKLVMSNIDSFVDFYNDVTKDIIMVFEKKYIGKNS